MALAGYDLREPELRPALFWDGVSGVALPLRALAGDAFPHFHPSPLPQKPLYNALMVGDTYGSRVSRPGGS